MTALIGPTVPPELHVMTFNVRRRMSGFGWRPKDRWANRRDAVHELLASETPSVLGVQEALADQAALIGAALGPRYRRVGSGRQPGLRGEGCPIFYDSERLELVRAEQTALSDRPNVAGSRSWGNPLPRVLVRATLRDRATSIVFTVLNTHLDPFSERSRVRSAAVIRRTAAESSPAIVTGDFNADPASRTVRELLSATGLRDAWATAATRLTPEWATYANYRAPRSAIGGHGRIDGIFVSAGIRVNCAAISTRRPGAVWPSDHLPMHAVVRLPSSTTPS